MALAASTGAFAAIGPNNEATFIGVIFLFWHWCWQPTLGMYGTYQPKLLSKTALFQPTATAAMIACPDQYKRR